MATEYFTPVPGEVTLSDDDLRFIAEFDPAPLSAEQIAELPGKGRHFVYGLYALPAGECPVRSDLANVYVGVTSNLRQRMRAHSKRWWWALCSQDLVEFIEHSTREAAERAEMESIRELNPDLNVALGVGRKVRVRR